MTKKEAIQVFEQRNIRSLWDDEAETWYFSIVDVVGGLTESPNPRKYWSVLKTRLKKEGSEVATNCSQLKMTAADGRKYQTDCATTEQLFRLIQSIPSPKAEPFKQWMFSDVAEEIFLLRQKRHDAHFSSPGLPFHCCRMLRQPRFASTLGC